ncbi:SUN domain-containing protein 3-like [Neopsephotus bourkii]|uniref:SUN domain-containing protein 3-like n=1 Tax=Neopsephotus bourkii TaxID=309878 RepID=UPI002AA595FA|nr:SUN domain-containing protein 3-like [Neopsephotus bourkii]
MQKLRDEVTHLAAEICSIKKANLHSGKRAGQEKATSWPRKRLVQGAPLVPAYTPLPCQGLRPDASPGYCWKMQQSQSKVLIRLPTEVQPTAITLQYCSKTATPLVTVSSAPKDFTVSGLDEEGQGETLLGSFLYSVQKEPTQTFPLQNGIPRAFRLLKLTIQNNWGKPTYTSIYRVQVHGKMVETNVVGKTDVETFPQ